MKHFNLSFKGLWLFIVLFSTSALAANYTVKSFTLTGTEAFKGSNLTVFATNAIGIFGTPTIDTVYYRMDPIQITSDEVIIPEMVFNIEGVKRPTHLAIIIHKQKAYSLNKLNSALLDGVPVNFEEPDYYNAVFRTPPKQDNIKLQHKIMLSIQNIAPLKLQQLINR